MVAILQTTWGNRVYKIRKLDAFIWWHWNAQWVSQKAEHTVCKMFSITMTSQWLRWGIKSPASRLFTQLFIQMQIKENIKAPRHWPLCGDFTGTGEFPAQRASYAENVSIWWRYHANVDWAHYAVTITLWFSASCTLFTLCWLSLSFGVFNNPLS